MSFYQPGDVVIVYFPFRENPAKVKLRPAVVASIESEKVYKLCQITGTDNSHFCRGEWIKADSELGKSIGLTKDSFVNMENIINVPASLIKKGPIGEYPDFEEVLKKHGINLD